MCLQGCLVNLISNIDIMDTFYVFKLVFTKQREFRTNVLFAEYLRIKYVHFMQPFSILQKHSQKRSCA